MAQVEPGTSGSILVLGGRSEIGVQVALLLCSGRKVLLAARTTAPSGEPDVSEQAALLRGAGAAAVIPVEFDADDTGAHEEFLAKITADYGAIDVAIVAFGILGDQERAQVDSAHAVAIAHTDYVAQVSILLELAATLKNQDADNSGRRGSIIAFSSVAGVRVRRANFVYGSAKAGLDGFLQGYTDWLHGSGVHVLNARPGFVVGNMTSDILAAGVKPAPMSSTAPSVARATVDALHKGKSVVWIPGGLRLLFAIFSVLPQAVWRRMPR